MTPDFEPRTSILLVDDDDVFRPRLARALAARGYEVREARDFDSAIAIRTAVARDGEYAYHAGGGIVADSDPMREHRECLLKAEPFLRALGVPDSAPSDDRGAP